MSGLRDAVEPVAGPRVTVAVVIPVWNEADAITAVVRELPRDLIAEIIVADGGSTDGTQDAARAAGATVIAPGRGYGRACHEGARAAGRGCDVIAFMDGDGADRGDLIGRILKPIVTGQQDFVIASRTRGVRDPGSMLWHQVMAGELAGRLIGARYGIRYTDMCAFRAIRRDALLGLDMREMTYGWNIEMQMKAARAGLRVLEVPMPYRNRAGGSSKVAGSLRGTVRASWKIGTTFLRVAGARG